MVNLIISGLPKNVKAPKFIAYLESTIFQSTIYAKLIDKVLHGNTKTIILGMRSNDARKARRILDGHEYLYAGLLYPLQCRTEAAEDRDQHYSRGHIDYHSVPPPTEQIINYSEQSQITMKKELKAIDQKIEMIRKQRTLMEEENKLLFEKKKSAMLKSIGPNDYENLMKFEQVCGRNDPNEMADLSNPSTSNAKKKSATKLPNFHAPRKMIVNEMKQVLAEYIESADRDLIMPLIYGTIRKRLINVVQDKTYLPCQDIVSLYRVAYPLITDRKLLEELKNTVTLSCWPELKNGDTKNDNECTQIMTKNEEAGVSDNITQDVTEDVKEENELQIVEETNKETEKTEVQIVEGTNKETENNELEIVEETNKETENNELQIVEETNKETEENELQIVEETNQETEKNESIKDASFDEKTLEDLYNIDQIVDMDNDLDEWVENDTKNEKEDKVEEQSEII